MVFKMINIFLSARDKIINLRYERAKSYYSTVEPTSIKLVLKNPVGLKLNLPLCTRAFLA